MVMFNKKLLLLVMFVYTSLAKDDKSLSQQCTDLKDAKCGKNCQKCDDKLNCSYCCPHYGQSSNAQDCERCKQTIDECADCDGNKDSCSKCAEGYTQCYSDDGNVATCYKCKVQNGCCQSDNSGTFYRCNNGFGKSGELCASCKDPNCFICNDDIAKCITCKNTGVDIDRWNLNKEGQCVTDCLKWYTGCISCDKDEYCSGCEKDFIYDDKVKSCYKQFKFKNESALWKTDKCTKTDELKDSKGVIQEYCSTCADGYMLQKRGYVVDSCLKTCSDDPYLREGCSRCRIFRYKIGEKNWMRNECEICFHQFEKIGTKCFKKGSEIKQEPCKTVGTGKNLLQIGQGKSACYYCRAEFCIDCFTDFTDCKKCVEKDQDKQKLYLDSATKRCVRCRVAYCDICSSADPYHLCDNCEPGFVKTTSDDRKYDLCQSNCDENCTCSDTIKCVACKPHFGKFQDNKVLKCKACEDPNCVVCEADFKTCTRCSSGYHRSSTFKCSACDVQFCEKHSENSGWQDSCSCQKCKDPYITNDKGGCVTKEVCITGCKPGNCTDELTCGLCLDGFGITRDDKCLACSDKNCQTCPDNYVECTKCKDGFVVALFQKDKDHKDPAQGCAVKCPDNCFCGAGDGKCSGCKGNFGWKSKDSHDCQSCADPNCEECYEDFNDCKACKDGHAISPTNKKCNKCNNVAPCEIFSKTEECLCDQCKEGAIKSAGTDGKQYCWFNINIEGCQQQTSNEMNACMKCNDAWFKTAVNKCAKCSHSKCIFCTKEQQCSNCNQGFQVQEYKDEKSTWSSCISTQCGIGCICNEGLCTTCSPGYGRDETSDIKCIFCLDKFCSECPGSYKFCSHCNGGYIKSKVDGFCSACDEINCKKHSSFKQSNGKDVTQSCQCLECNTDYKLLNGACVPVNCSQDCVEGKCERKDTCFECKDKFGQENEKCVPCSKYTNKCVECSIQAQICQHCEDGWLLKAITLNSGGSQKIYCIGHCPDGCNCHKNNGICTNCEFKFQYGPKVSDDKKTIQCLSCMDPKCQDCRFNWDHCFKCQVGTGHNGQWGHEEKDQSDSNDEKDKCKTCGNPWCKTKHFLDDGSNDCWCKDCVQPAIHVGNACVFPINIDGCGNYYSNYPNFCWSCKNNFRSVRGQCERCKDVYCIECSTAADLCNHCPDDFITSTLGEGANKKQSCIQSTCTSSCNCLQGRCISCRERSGILDQKKEQTTDGSYVCRECNDTQCKRCDQNFIVCFECEDGYGYDVLTTNLTFYSRRCTRCDINSCIKCDKQKDVCTQCKPEYKLDTTDFIGSCILTSGAVANCKIHVDKDWCKTCNAGHGSRNDYQKWTNQCEKCAENCKECENKDICFECNDWFIADPPANKNYENKPNKCEFDCSHIEYCSKCSFNWQCAQCSWGYGISKASLQTECRRCNQITCFSCNKDYKYCDSNGCFSDSDIQWIEGICKPIKCPENCKDCEDPHFCIKCVDHFGLNSIQTCKSCTDVRCLDCSSDMNKCEKCADSYKLEGDPEGNRTSYCKGECTNGCSVCKGKNECQQCKQGQGLQPENTADKDCKKCKDRLCWDCYKDWQNCCRCAAMSEYLNKKCQTTCQKLHCNVGQCQDYGQCDKEGCITGTYWNPKAIQCFDCPQIQCKACDQATNTCTDCNSGYSLNETKSRCNVICNANCQYCESPSTCYQCNNEYVLTAKGTCEKRTNTDKAVCKHFTVDNSCDECVDDLKYVRKTYKKTVEGKEQVFYFCGPICDENCEFCQDVQKCAHCKSAFSLTSDGTCGCSIKNCKLCEKKEKDFTCKECLWGYSLEKTAAERTYCKIICQDYCTCFNPEDCDDCIEGYFKQNGSCQPTCKDKNCNYCLQDNPNFCVYCHPGFGANIAQNNQCYRCLDIQCKWCGEDYLQCFRCKDNYGWGIEYSTNLKCAESKGGADSDKYKCQLCAVKNCLQCNFDIDHCEICRFEYFLDIENNKCIPKVCQIDFCDRCTQSSTVCESCESHYGLNDYKDGCVKCAEASCVDCHENFSYCSLCYDRFGIDKDQSSCKRCHDNHCKDCGNDYHDCKVCDKEWKWKKGDGENWAQCWHDVPLPPNCKQLNKDGDCQICNEGFSPWQGYCFKSNECNKVKNCLRCYNDNASFCLECALDYVIKPSLDECLLWCDKTLEELKFCFECKNAKSEKNKCQKCNSGYRVKNDGCEKADSVNVIEEEIDPGKKIEEPKTSNGGIPWWVWLLIGVAIIIVVIIIIVFCISGKKSGNERLIK